MADAQSNIKVSIDTTEALASIKNLQRQISAFHTSMAKSGAAANAVTSQMQQNLINSVNATGKFSAQMKTIKTTTESFTDSLQKNKFSMGEYFRYAGGASKTFGKLFKTEFDTINKVARENVKDLQTQYIKMGRDASGSMKAIAVRPLSLDMNDLATKTMIASEKQALLNQLLKQGSTNLLNFGKNTQWAGRQLMVGFTLPLVSLGAAASKTFMDMEAQAIRFKKVYGDLFTPASETEAALEGITELGKQFTKYGIAVSTTVGLAAEAAAAGFQGLDLQRQTTAATKLSILGQVDSQKALETTIALQNAFSMSSENLAESIDFLNAVENQTVLSLDDVSTAIPKAAPIVQQLGGDVKDLAFFMTAMKEGGINASEGANALKSGLASLINPTGKAAAMLEGFGINARKIVVDNKGDLKKTVIEFATALNQLDPLNRAQAIEQMFGKFQFSRLSTLFANVTKEGTQAARVLDLAGSSVQELAALSEKELGMTSESAMNKFKGAVEDLKLSLVPVGEEFLKAVTPIAEFISKILDRFNNLGDSTKKIIVTLTAVIAGLGPILLMTFGLLANGVANIIKGFTAMKTLFNKTGQSSATLGTEVRYMTLEQRNAAAVAASLDQVHRRLAQTFTSEAAAVNALTAAYQRSLAAQSQFMPVARPMGRGPIKKFAKGKPSIIGGTGNKDSELALLQPGETVIPTKMSKKYGALINGMIADNIPGYSVGKPGSNTVASHIEGLTPSQLVATLSDPIMKKVLESLPDVGIGLQTLSTTTDGMVTVSKTIETSLKDLSNTLSQNNIEDATAIGTKGFAGTTIEASSERNLMLNAAGIAGDPITFEQMQEARNKAQSYIDRPVKNETDAVKAQRQEAQNLIQEQLEFEKSLTGISQQEAEARKANFTKTKTTQALEYALTQKGLSASEASTLAKQQIADAEKSTLKLVQGSKTELEKRKIKEAAYQATLLKEMGLVAGYDEKNTKTDVFNKTQLNAVPRDMAKGQVQFGTPYKPGEEVPEKAAVFGSGKSFKGLSGDRIRRNQSAIIDASIRDEYYADRNRAKNSFKNGSDNGKSYRKGVQSANVPDIYEDSRKRNSPHPLAPKDGKDDARAYSEAKNKEIKRQSGRTYRTASRPQGAPVQEVVPGKRVRRSASRGGGTVGAGGIIVAPTSFVSQIDEGPMLGPNRPTKYDKTAGAVTGKFRNVAGQVGTKVAGKGAALGMAGNSAMIAASFLPGKMGELAQKIMPAVFGFQALSMILKMLPGPFKLVTLGLAATVGIVKLLNAAKERERLAVEGLGDAATVSEKKLKTLGDFFGIVPTKLDFISKDSAVKTTGADAQEQSAIDSLQENEAFQKDFKKDIESLRKGNNAQAKLVFDSIAVQLRGSGFAKEQIDLIIKALQEESGKTDFKFDFANIDLSTDEGMLNFDKNFGNILKDIDEGITQIEVLGQTAGQANRIVTQFSEGSKQNIKLAADAATGFINGLRGQLENGTISADQFNAGFVRISSSIATMPKPEQILLLDSVFKTLPKNLQNATDGMTDTGQRMKILQVQSLGLTGAALELADAFNILNTTQVYGPEGASKLNETDLRINRILADAEKRAKELEKRFKSDSSSSVKDFQNIDDETNGGKKLTAEEKYLKILDKQIDSLQAKLDAQKKINDEIQREVDLANKLQDLESQAVNAKISGNYIQASLLKQQSQQAQAEFDRDTSLNRQQEPIDALMARKKAIQDGAKLTAAEKAQIPKKANGGLIKGPGTGRSDSIRATLGYAGGGSIRVSNGEFVVKASSVRDYGLNAMNAVNNGTANIDTNPGGTVYNINMPITSNNASPEGVANEVMRRLKVELNKNNKSNAVRI
jgi:TP901 family phage tail tape measure protein